MGMRRLGTRLYLTSHDVQEDTVSTLHTHDGENKRHHQR